METFLDREYFEGSQNNDEVRGNYKLNPDRSEPTAVYVWRGHVRASFSQIVAFTPGLDAQAVQVLDDVEDRLQATGI